MALENVDKQPADVLDWDADFSAFCKDRADTGASQTVTVTPSGLTVVSSARIDSTDKHDVAGVTASVVKMFFSGGTDKANYHVTVALTTTGGRTLEYDFIIKVREL